MLVNRRAALVVGVHNAVWAGAIVLIGTDLIRYNTSSTEAWLVLITALTVFNLGSIIGISRSRFVREDRRRITSGSPGWLVTRRVLILLVVLYAAAVAVYLDSIASRFGPTTLFVNPASIRSASGESYLESVPVLARLGLCFGPLLIALLGFKEAVKDPLRVWLRYGLLALVAVSLLLLLQRMNLFMGVLMLVALIISRQVGESTSRRTLTRTVVPVVVAGLVLPAAFQVVGGVLGKSGQQALSTGAVSEPLERSGLTSVFVYYTAGTVAFLHLVDSTNYDAPPDRIQGKMRIGDNNPQTWGAMLFSPALKFAPGVTPGDTISPFVDTGVLTNVFTWIEPFFRDFRFAGVVVGMFLLGLGSSLGFAARTRSTVIYWTQACVFSTIFLATFALRLNSTAFLAGIVLIVGLAALKEFHPPRSRAALSPVASSSPLP